MAFGGARRSASSSPRRADKKTATRSALGRAGLPGERRKKATGLGEGIHRDPLATVQRAVMRGTKQPVEERTAVRAPGMGRPAAENGAAALEREQKRGERERATQGQGEIRVPPDLELLRQTCQPLPHAISATYEPLELNCVSRSGTMFQMWIPDLTRSETRTAFRDRRGSC